MKVYRNPRAGQGSGEAGRERIPLPRYLRLQAPLQLADMPACPHRCGRRQGLAMWKAMGGCSTMQALPLPLPAG